MKTSLEHCVGQLQRCRLARLKPADGMTWTQLVTSTVAGFRTYSTAPVSQADHCFIAKSAGQVNNKLPAGRNGRVLAGGKRLFVRVTWLCDTSLPIYVHCSTDTFTAFPPTYLHSPSLSAARYYSFTTNTFHFRSFINTRNATVQVIHYHDTQSYFKMPQFIASKNKAWQVGW